MPRFGIAFALLCLVLTGTAAASASRSWTGSTVHYGVRIEYEVRGEGEPLVLIPGISQSRFAWEAAGYVDAFVESGRTVITIDPRGHGDSDKPHDPAAYSDDLVADDIISVLDSLQIERADLLGYSRGGWIAINAATRHPERVRLVIAGGAHPHAEDLSPFREAMSGGLRQWVALIEKRVGHLPRPTCEMFLANDIQALRAAVESDRPDMSQALRDSGVPVLLFVGSEDPRAPIARSYAEDTPNTEYLELPRQDHFQAFFNAETVAAAVNRKVRELTRAARLSSN